LQYYLEALELVREQGNRERIRGFLTNAATILTHLGRYGQAENYLVEADAIAQALESEWSIADTQIARGNLYIAQKKFVLATQAFQIALENAEQAAMPEIQADALWGLGKVAKGEENYPEASRLGLISLDLMEKVGLNSEAHALRDWLDELPKTE
jgi:tetratricopeptide (TPR) repeat protein